MRTLKGSGNHLRNQTLKNAAKAAGCALLLGVVGLFLIYRMLTARVGIFEEAIAVLGIAPLAGFLFYLRKYHIYRGGWEGEKRVAKLLRQSLSDDYLLINGLRLRGGGDVDHIVLGPNGIFALETKNWSGKISCVGDSWQRDRGRHLSASPSEQAKRNAAKLRQMLQKEAVPNARVEPILVFTNRHASLIVRNSTVSVVKLQDLPAFLKSQTNTSRFSAIDIDAFGKALLKR